MAWTRFIAAIGFTAFALPFASFGQTPTPFPSQPTPTLPPPEVAATPAPEPEPTPDPELRAVDVLPPEMVRRPGFGKLGKPTLSPTFAMAVAGRSVKNHPGEGSVSVDFWLGARFHPFVGSAGPFMAAGAEINLREHWGPEEAPLPRESTTYTEFVPEMRWGFAFMRKPYNDYINTVFPNVELYGIAGWRIGNRFQGNALRVGAGVSSPALMLISATCDMPIPAMFEVTMDVDSLHTGERDYAFRIGWHF